jgi:hypothetical protein
MRASTSARSSISVVASERRPASRARAGDQEGRRVGGVARDRRLGGVADRAHDAMGLHGLTGGEHVPGDQRGRPAQKLDPVGGARMQRLAPRHRERLVEGVAQEHVRERESPVALTRQHAGELSFPRGGFHVVDRHAGERGDVGLRSFPAQDRGGGQDLARRRRDPGQVLRHDGRDPTRSGGREAIHPEAHRLLDEERVPFAQAMDLRGVPREADAREPARGVAGVESPQGNDAPLAPELPDEIADLRPLRELVLARRHDEERAPSKRGARERQRELEARDVGGVQIVEDDDHGRFAGAAQRADETVEGDDSLRARHLAGGAPEQLVEVEPELAHRLRPRPVRRRVPHLPRAPEADACTARLRLRRKGACQGALADACLAGNDQRTATSRRGVLESALGDREGLGAAKQRHAGPSIGEKSSRGGDHKITRVYAWLPLGIDVEAGSMKEARTRLGGNVRPRWLRATGRHRAKGRAAYRFRIK